MGGVKGAGGPRVPQQQITEQQQVKKPGEQLQGSRSLEPEQRLKPLADGPPIATIPDRPLDEEQLQARTGQGNTGQAAANFAKDAVPGQVAPPKGGVLDMLMAQKRIDGLAGDTGVPVLINKKPYVSGTVSGKLSEHARQKAPQQLAALEAALAKTDCGLENKDEAALLRDALQGLPPDVRSEARAAVENLGWMLAPGTYRPFNQAVRPDALEQYGLPISKRLDPEVYQKHEAQIDKIDNVLEQALVDLRYNDDEMKALVAATQGLPPDALAAVQDALTAKGAALEGREAYNLYKNHFDEPAEARVQAREAQEKARAAEAKQLKDDAAILRRAMGGAFDMTDEQAIYDVLGRIPAEQKAAGLEALKQTYQTDFGRDLIRDLGKELSISEWEQANQAVGGALGEHPAEQVFRDLRALLGKLRAAPGFNPFKSVE